MTKTTSILLLAAGLIANAGLAGAQTTKNLFLDVNGGVQAVSRTFVVAGEHDVYGEAATFSSSHKVKSAPLVDVSGGYRVWRDLSIGLGFSYAGTSSDAAMTVAVPHPLFHDRRLVSELTPEVTHSERTLYLQAIWTVPVTDKIDASFMAGPSIINVSQDVANGITVATGTQNATALLESQSDTATGFNVGADLSYLVTPRYGVGGFVRYVRGEVGLPSVEELKLGGFQIGGGFRVRF
jgi:hypothetical protein